MLYGGGEKNKEKKTTGDGREEEQSSRGQEVIDQMTSKTEKTGRLHDKKTEEKTRMSTRHHRVFMFDETSDAS